MTNQTAGGTAMFEQDTACAALELDRDRLLAAVESARSGQPPQIMHNPVSGAAMTVLDLVGHVAMWDEIVLAVLSEARRGRAHWYVTPQWETVAAGRALNTGGVAAWRQLPEALTLDRFVRGRNALASAIAEVPGSEWHGELAFAHSSWQPQTLAGLSHHVNTPEADPERKLTYLHASVHLGL
jgi:hypothetical protein